MFGEFILRILDFAMSVVNAAIWVYVISSWLVNVHEVVWKINRFLGQFIEPLLAPIRKLMYPITMKIGLDFSPYVLAIVTSWVFRIVYNFVALILPF